MDLWILSQKKDKLVKTNLVRLDYFKDKLTNEEFYIITNDDYDFGVYKTEERALEVIGEIQKLLVPDIKLLSKKINEDQEDDLSDLKTLFSVIQPDGELQIHQLHNVIYQMPQE